jgi:hypothetical protein
MYDGEQARKVERAGLPCGYAREVCSTIGYGCTSHAQTCWVERAIGEFVLGGMIVMILSCFLALDCGFADQDDFVYVFSPCTFNTIELEQGLTVLALSVNHHLSCLFFFVF